MLQSEMRERLSTNNITKNICIYQEIQPETWSKNKSSCIHTSIITACFNDNNKIEIFNINLIYEH